MHARTHASLQAKKDEEDMLRAQAQCESQEQEKERLRRMQREDMDRERKAAIAQQVSSMYTSADACLPFPAWRRCCCGVHVRLEACMHACSTAELE